MLKPSGKKATPGRLFASEEVEKLDSEDLNLLHETAGAIRRSGRVAYSDAKRTPVTIQVGQAIRFISDTCSD